MWHDMFSLPIPVLEKVLRTVFVYALVVLLFRLTGKRGLASMNTFDFVVIFLLSNIVQNAIIGADNSFTGGAIGAVTLVTVNAGVTRWLAADNRAEHLLEGTASQVVEDGRIVPGALGRLAIRRDELENAIRVQNGDGVEDVESASLEPSGHLVVDLLPAARGATHGDLGRIESRLARIEQLLSGHFEG